MRKSLILIACFFVTIGLYSQIKIYTSNKKIIHADSIHSEDSIMLVYEKNKSLHDIYTHNINKIEFNNETIIYKNGVKQVALKKEAVLIEKVTKKEETPDIPKKEAESNSYKLTNFNVKFSVIELLSQYHVLMFGAEYIYKSKFGICHSIGVALSDGNYLSYDDDFFHQGGIVNKTELRNYFFNKYSPYSKNVNRYFIGIDMKHRFGYRNEIYYESEHVTSSVNKLGIHIKMGVQRLETQHILLDFYAGLGINYLWGYTKITKTTDSYDGLNNKTKQSTTEEKIDTANPTLVIGVKIGFGMAK